MEKSIQEYWWVYMVQGILLALLGIALLSWPGLTIVTLIILLALYLIVDGTIRAVSGLFKIGQRKGWYWTVIGGIVMVLVGLITIAYPGLSTVSFVYLVGFGFILKGIMEFANSGDKRKAESSRGLTIFVGILDILIGLYLIFNPLVGGLVYFWVFGLYALISGIVVFVKSISLRSKPLTP